MLEPMQELTVVGAGLAGCEAALQASQRGVRVRLVEMRPGVQTEAHRTGDVAELVCSNSFKSIEPGNAHGLLKAELGIHGCVLLGCAERSRVPGGKALVVDRERFSAEVAGELDRAGVTVERAEVEQVGPAVDGATVLLRRDCPGSGGRVNRYHGCVCRLAVRRGTGLPELPDGRSPVSQPG
jgi:methylenetetrahydrofolate--tRNA-(uracil-5-)-methyltransferase